MVFAPFSCHILRYVLYNPQKLASLYFYTSKTAIDQEKSILFYVSIQLILLLFYFLTFVCVFFAQILLTRHASCCFILVINGIKPSGK